MGAKYVIYDEIKKKEYKELTIKEVMEITKRTAATIIRCYSNKTLIANRYRVLSKVGSENYKQYPQRILKAWDNECAKLRTYYDKRKSENNK